MPASATTTNTGISVKRFKPIVDLVRGMDADEALKVLAFLPSPAAAQVAKVVKSAMANAEDVMLNRPSSLRITEIYANEATRLKRFRPRAMGRVGRVRRRSSHVTVVVDEEGR
jgi:large subunit ribosomal protein L22